MFVRMMVGLTALGTGAVASASEVPADDPPELRHVNSGFGFGIAYLAADTPASAQRFGLHVDHRSEVALSRSFQFDFVIGAGLTTPENTVAVVRWGTGAGRSITHAFGDVQDWARRGRDTGVGGLRAPAAFFAYFGLSFSYLVVPIAYVLSPFASIGHTVIGPTISWHTSPESPDAYVEVGVGGTLYGDPVFGGPGVGFGPMVGAGAHVGKQTVGLRLLVSPPALHASGQPSNATILTGAFVVGL